MRFPGFLFFSLSIPLGWFPLGCPFVPYGHHVYAGLLPICVFFSLGASPLLVCFQEVFFLYFLTRENGTDRLSRNVGTKLPLYAA